MSEAIKDLEDWEFIQAVKDEAKRRLKLMEDLSIPVSVSEYWSEQERCAFELMMFNS